MAGQFYINARVKLDTTGVQSQLNKVKVPNINTKSAEKGIIGLSSKVKGLGNDFVSTTAKVAKFGLSTAIIGAFTSAVTGSVKVVKDFDDALTEFKKVSDLSGKALDDYTQKLGDLGTTVARTRKFRCECV